MATLDIAMPIALLAVSTVALLLNKRTEGKLKTTFEERELRTRDIVMLVVMIVVAVSVIGYVSILDPGQIFQNIIMLVFLFSYSMLLFIFSYLFSGMKQRKAQLFSLGFAVASLVAGTVGLLKPFADGLALYRALAFYGLAAFALASIIIDAKKAEPQERLYIAVQPPALFVLLFVFFNVAYDGAAVWYPALMDVFALTFAVLIILYLGSLFTWKTTLVFAGLLTIVDTILVLGTGTMITAAQQFTGLGLPVLVFLPKFPLIPIPAGSNFIGFFGFIPSGLGLGDFFFAGILALQTFKKFDKKTAIISTVTMTLSFAVWLAFIEEITSALEPLLGYIPSGFPGTLMIITGWIPIVAWKLLSERKQKTQDNEMDQKIGNDALPEQGT
jgi:presenilin-like A22 family membrane protease